MAEQFWIILDADGVVVEPCVCTSSPDRRPRDEGCYWEDDWQAIPVAGPVDVATTLWDGSAYVANLAALRARRWDAVRAARDAAKFGGCNTPFGRVDTTTDSLILANGASSTAMAEAARGEPFSIGWTMEDNTTVALDGAQMIAVGVLMAQHVGACHAVGVAKRAAIEAATTAEEISAVSLGGWPS